ncbi:SDR family NAD(P)-dependent oxidoreductase [Haliangium ochraceum]|uniref:Short-chain dehydrogenase/reductase SDR n=1 Tax=Haliangium ochraceum (strain DSM 14365 / JCM 11303 / SMP-2) TaxID=502025 RepID=D0LSP0_HALO1|nr:SDR family NAD(P)-dependent oxidoreductase [Haliangium ochraceum]ACY17262.1 short-chain dehydrogenase/reductase SDR [Haliangium ochraceum DSM 14365]
MERNHIDSTSSPRRVLITGASRGLGLALATQLRARGAIVVGIARDAQALRAALEPLGALPLAADLGSADADALATRASSLAGGPFDLFIHAASTLGPLGEGDDPMPRLTALDAAAMAQVFAVNALGPAALVRALHRSMRTGSGTIAVVSSDAAEHFYPGWGAYGASKTALDHLVRTWAVEEQQLRFVSVDPGEMDTRMHADAMPGADRNSLAAPADVASAILAQLERVPSGSRFAAEVA